MIWDLFWSLFFGARGALLLLKKLISRDLFPGNALWDKSANCLWSTSTLICIDERQEPRNSWLYIGDTRDRFGKNEIVCILPLGGLICIFFSHGALHENKSPFSNWEALPCLPSWPFLHVKRWEKRMNTDRYELTLTHEARQWVTSQVIIEVRYSVGSDLSPKMVPIWNNSITYA